MVCVLNTDYLVATATTDHRAKNNPKFCQVWMTPPDPPENSENSK